MFNRAGENNKLELYKHLLDDAFSYTQLEGNVVEVLGLSHISTEVLQPEIHDANITKTYRKLAIEKSQTDGFHIILKVILEF